MIPFFKYEFGKEEEQAVLDCMRSGWTVQGPKTEEFEVKFAEYVGAKYAVFVDSCTSALFLAIKACKIPLAYKWGVPSLTFVSTAETAVNAGYTPRFIDVDRKSFCMSGTVGHPCTTVNLLGNLSDAYFPTVIDSAHRIERDDVRGSDAIWCYSFYATKNMTTVQGGMIALNDKDKYEWLKKARDHGISKGTKERYTEKTPTYEIEFVGYRMKGDDLRASIGLEQLKKLPYFTERRNEIVRRYNKNLGLYRRGNHLYPILVSDRKGFFDAMSLAGIQVSVHFLPLDLMPAFKQWIPCDHEKDICLLPNTHYLGARLVSLPLFVSMTNEQIDYISQKVLETNLLIHE